MAEPAKGKAKVQAALRVTAAKAMAAAMVKVLAKAMAKAKAELQAGSKTVDLDKVPAMEPQAALRAAAVASAAELVAEVGRKPFLLTFRMAATMTSLRVNCAKLQCRSKILSCARNSGRSTAITRRARAKTRNHLTLSSYSLESRSIYEDR
jgi:hypothetical protein